MTTDKDTNKPGWKAHSVVALISVAVGIVFLTGGATISIIAGTSLLGLAVYHFVVALRLRRDLNPPIEEKGRP
ncbi:UNVERIFIED_ORG: multisubunit Na+/H+ antiporter MnhC subunit [Rhodococcus erythropolis]